MSYIRFDSRIVGSHNISLYEADKDENPVAMFTHSLEDCDADCALYESGLCLVPLADDRPKPILGFTPTTYPKLADLRLAMEAT